MWWVEYSADEIMQIKFVFIERGSWQILNFRARNGQVLEIVNKVLMSELIIFDGSLDGLSEWRT